MSCLYICQYVKFEILQTTCRLWVVGCMSCLYICLYVKFEILQTTCRLWVVHALYARDRNRTCHKSKGDVPTPNPNLMSI
jgi:hypothetical protein